jgi:hypothetical protein
MKLNHQKSGDGAGNLAWAHRVVIFYLVFLITQRLTVRLKNTVVATAKFILGVAMWVFRLVEAEGWEFHTSIHTNIRCLNCNHLQVQYIARAFVRANKLISNPTARMRSLRSPMACYSYCASNQINEEMGFTCESNFGSDDCQLRQDWADLEEDDECIFYLVALFDKDGKEFQSFTMYR